MKDLQEEIDRRLKRFPQLAFAEYYYEQYQKAQFKLKLFLVIPKYQLCMLAGSCVVPGAHCVIALLDLVLGAHCVYIVGLGARDLMCNCIVGLGATSPLCLYWC